MPHAAQPVSNPAPQSTQKRALSLAERAPHDVQVRKGCLPREC